MDGIAIPSSPPVRRQRGISLVVSMILLAAITILSLTASRSTLLELTMSGNEQKRLLAFEKAESAIDALYENRANVIDFNSNLGHTNCTSNVSGGCDSQTLTLPSGGFDSRNQAWSTRVGEATLVCPPAFLEISCTDAKAAFFELRSQYDDRAAGGGNVVVTQGLLSILPDQD